MKIISNLRGTMTEPVTEPIIEIVYRFTLVYDIDPYKYLIPDPRNRVELSVPFPLHALVQNPAGIRPEWKTFVDGYALQFDTLYVERITPLMRRVLKFTDPPCILARLSAGRYRIIMNEKQLQACKGDVAFFQEVLKESLWDKKFILSERETPWEELILPIQIA